MVEMSSRSGLTTPEASKGPQGGAVPCTKATQRLRVLSVSCTEICFDLCIFQTEKEELL